MPYRNQIPRSPQALTLATSLRVATCTPKVSWPPIKTIERSSYQCRRGLKDGTYWTRNKWEISGSYKLIQTPWLGLSHRMIICAGCSPKCSYQSSPRPSRGHSSGAICPHIPHVSKILPRPPMKKYVGRRRNTTIAELSMKVNVGSIIDCAAWFRHQNIDIRSALEGGYFSSGDMRCGPWNIVSHPLWYRHRLQLQTKHYSSYFKNVETSDRLALRLQRSDPISLWRP